MTITFEEITRRRVVSFICNVCAKSRRRTLRVTHTLSPYNQNPDGTVRTRGEVSEAISAELDKMITTTFVCATCAKKKA